MFAVTVIHGCSVKGCYGDFPLDWRVYVGAESWGDQTRLAWARKVSVNLGPGSNVSISLLKRICTQDSSNQLSSGQFTTLNFARKGMITITELRELNAFFFNHAYS